MSFDRLIVCVDNSGSMCGDKIKNAKQACLSLVKMFKCDTKYFSFEETPQERSKDEFSQLGGCGGTRIEYTLMQLFDYIFPKWAHEGKNTKFFFVTDACDRISNVAKCIEAKVNCIRKFGNKLDCECLLTGGGGGCSAELEEIFGTHAFKHCSNTDFQKTIQAQTADISKANDIARDVLPNMESEITKLKQSEQKQNGQVSAEMNQIVNSLKEVKKKSDAAQQKISTAKSEIATLNDQTATIISNADGATGEAEMERAEEAIEQHTKSYQSQYKNVNQAGKELNEAAKALQEEGKKADKMAEDLYKKTDNVSKQAQVILANVIKTIKDLTSITTGAYHQVKHLKAEFNKQLSDLLSVVSHNESLMTEFQGIKDSIQNSFKALRKQRTDLDDFKKEIASHIQSLNMALGRLDDRF